MKTVLLIAGIVICSLFLFIKCKPSDKNISEAVEPVKQDKTQQDTAQNNYTKLRQMALQVTQKDLGLHLDDQNKSVYGIVMDWEMDGATATVVSFATGDASLYLSSGSGVIGGGQHENVNKAAKKLVASSQNYLKQSVKTNTTPLPETQSLKFYFLTSNGIFMGEEKMENIESETSKWYPLFVETNEVLSALRLVSEK